MAWLGQTVSKLDTRREIGNFITSQTTAGRVCITNAAGELSSSSIALAELALLSGVTSPIQAQLDSLGFHRNCGRGIHGHHCKFNEGPGAREQRNWQNRGGLDHHGAARDA